MTEVQLAALCAQSESRVTALKAELRQLGSALVAFSGGVDSALVLKFAVDELGESAVALTAVSPSLPPEEAEEAQDFARRLGARHVLVNSKEIEDPRYVANGADRCYFCKSELHSLTARYREELGLAVVLDGFNADDQKDHRPGNRAAKERGVRSPLSEAGLTKAEVRAWSHRLGLPTWDKPQMACLASRLPYGTQVTVDRLRQVGGAEKALRKLGFVHFRVRHHQQVARVELAEGEFSKLADLQLRRAMNDALKAQGFTFVAVDVEPFRSGRLNEGLALPAATLPVL